VVSYRALPCFVFALACAVPLVSTAAAQTQSGDQVVVPLTDPSRPAVLSVSAFSGNIVVRGTNRKDVIVRSSDGGRGQSRRRQAEPPPGLRRLTPDAAFSIEERNNEVSVEGSFCSGSPDPAPNPNPSRGRPGKPFLPSLPKGLPCGPMFDSVDFDIEVPLKTNLKLSTVMGNVTVNTVDGVLEVNSLNGGLSLTNVGGSIVAHTVNGSVTAVLTRADAEAPMAFATLNGDVDVTLPAAVKANLKLRTYIGDIFTDFDIPAASSRPTPRGSRQDDGRFRFEVERAILANLNGGGPDIELRSFNGRVYLRRGK
jgi:hypothetical protein